MKWLERFAWLVAGLIISSALMVFLGHLTLSGEFAANVTGAAIGGLISVGLAILMFSHERKIAISDAANASEAQRCEAIRQSLRHVRSIRECVFGATAITINSSERILRSLNKARELTSRALEDHNLTDIPLRLTMEDAAGIAAHTAGRLQHDLQNANLTDANDVVPTAKDICATALASIDKLMDTYTKIRKLPAFDSE